MLPMVIIQARMGSTRLPGKIMLDILGKPVLWHVVMRASRAKYTSGVVIATTENREDDVVEDFCKANNIPFYRGAQNDVLDRYYRCAKAHGIKDIVRITADCPMQDPNIIDLVINDYMQGSCDYATNTLEPGFPEGFDVEVFSFTALEDAWNNAKLPSEREHVTPYIRNHDRFMKKSVRSQKKYPNYHCSMDRNEDYIFIKSVFEGIGKIDFNIDDIIVYLDRHRELLEINQHVIKNEGYLRSLKEDEAFLSGDLDGKR